MNLNLEIVKMSISSTLSVSLILIGAHNQRAVVFMKELLKGQTLSPAFTNSDIIAWLLYEHMTVKPVVVETVDEKNTLLVSTESEDIEKICNTL